MTAGLLQEVENLGLPQRLCDGDRSLPVAVDGVDFTASASQEFDHFHLPCLHRHVEWRLLAQVLGVKIRT